MGLFVYIIYIYIHIYIYIERERERKRERENMLNVTQKYCLVFLGVFYLYIIYSEPKLFCVYFRKYDVFFSWIDFIGNIF